MPGRGSANMCFSLDSQKLHNEAEDVDHWHSLTFLISLVRPTFPLVSYCPLSFLIKAEKSKIDVWFASINLWIIVEFGIHASSSLQRADEVGIPSN